MTVTIEDVRAAQARLAGQIANTPCVQSRTLSEITGAALWLKFENLQYTASFKERGALNRLAPAQARAGGGGRGRDVGRQPCAGRGLPCAPPGHTRHHRDAARDAVRESREHAAVRGAWWCSRARAVEDAARHAWQLAEAQGLTFVHPFDDAAVIAGQGTLALEMLAAAPDLEVLVIPIGGGGLIGGIATAAKAVKPGIEIIGVEAALYPSVYRRLRGLPAMAGGPTIAEGIAVKEPGNVTFPIIERPGRRCGAGRGGRDRGRGAAVAGDREDGGRGRRCRRPRRRRQLPGAVPGPRVGLVLCGGNIDSRLLSAVILRGLVRTQRLVRLRVGVPDSPGSLVRIATIVAEQGGNIVDVIHQRAFSKLSVKQADVDLTIETRTAEHAGEIGVALEAGGFEIIRLDVG